MLLFRLEPSDPVSLCLTNNHLCDFSGNGLNVLKKDHEQRLKLYRVLDLDLPDYRFCSGCSKFHKRQTELEEQFPCVPYQAYSRCTEANIPLFHGIYLSWPSTQLALRGLYYESWKYSCTTKTSGNIRGLANTYDNSEQLTWNYQLYWSNKNDGITITLQSLGEWLAQTRIEPNQCRGLLMKLSWADASCTKSNLIAERTINMGANDYWATNTAQPGWNPPSTSTAPRSRRRGRTRDQQDPNHDAFDPNAGLPGRHWGELPKERRRQGNGTWSGWQWCPRTGKPSNGSENLEITAATNKRAFSTLKQW